MNRFDALKRWTWSVFIVFTLAFAFAGCEGDDGAQGPAGPAGPPGADGQDGADGTDATTDPLTAALAATKVESCNTCHGGAGQLHQDFYDLAYNDESKIALTITGVSSVDNLNGTFTVTADFSITFNGQP